MSSLQWTKKMERLLGESSDAQVARQLGLGKRRVRSRREKLGIPPSEKHAPQFRWTKARDRLLGTMPDTELAERIGAPLHAIRYRREQLNIAAYTPEPAVEGDPRSEPYPWTPAEDALIGTMHDTELAEKLRIAHSTVTYRRIQLGKVALRPTAHVDWTDGLLNLLGQVSDAEVAREYEISPTTVKLKRLELGIPQVNKDHIEEPELPADVIAQVGKIPDQHLAEVYSVSRLRIREYRAIHHIAAVTWKTPTKFKWGKKHDRLLGTMSDGTLGRKLGIPQAQVRNRRVRLGIPPHGYDGKIRWTRKRLEQLGRAPDLQLARRWGCPYDVVRKKRESLDVPPPAPSGRQWTKQELAKLGTMHDTALAQQLEISATAVRNKRTEQGIAPFTPTPKKRRWKKTELKLLGQLTDTQVARRLQISDSCVQEKRNELGIPKAKSHGGVWGDPRNRAKLGTMSDGQLARQLGVTPSAVRLKRVAMEISPWKPDR